MEAYRIRREMPEEQREVENLIRESFWNVYRPGCLEHFVMHRLRNDPAFIPELDLVLIIGESGREKIIGQIMCMEAEIRTDTGKPLPVMTFGPIGILPDYKRQGYGKALLDHTMRRAAEMGYGAVCMEGNIGFYGKCGFTLASDFGLRYHGMLEGADAPFFLCRELKAGYLAGVSGEYAPPQGYMVDESECEEFDRSFPPKEKLTLPGQLWQ